MSGAAGAKCILPRLNAEGLNLPPLVVLQSAWTVFARPWAQAWEVEV